MKNLLTKIGKSNFAYRCVSIWRILTTRNYILIAPRVTKEYLTYVTLKTHTQYRTDFTDDNNLKILRAVATALESKIPELNIREGGNMP